MINNYIDYIDINEIRRGQKEKYKTETSEKTEEIIFNKLSKGVLYRGKLIEVVYKKFFNPLSNRENCWYYFICPECGKRAIKLYLAGNNKIGCRKCSKIKNKSLARSQNERIFKISSHIADIFNRNKVISKKKRKQLLNDILNHYNNLDERYKLAYNSMMFKELQNWCLDTINKDDSKSKEYKKALKDILKILGDVRKVLVQSGLSIAKNKNLKI